MENNVTYCKKSKRIHPLCSSRKDIWKGDMMVIYSVSVLRQRTVDSGQWCGLVEGADSTDRDIWCPHNRLADADISSADPASSGILSAKVHKRARFIVAHISIRALRESVRSTPKNQRSSFDNLIYIQ